MTAKQPCRCEAWDFPHRLYSGGCMGHDLADCPALVRTPDPYGTGDWWYVWIEHGCGRNNGAAGYSESVYKKA